MKEMQEGVQHHVHVLGDPAHKGQVVISRSLVVPLSPNVPFTVHTRAELTCSGALISEQRILRTLHREKGLKDMMDVEMKGRGTDR